MRTDAEKPSLSDGGAVTIESIGVSLEQWFKLPLPLRRRWWQETEYSKKAPSSDLVQAIVAAAAREL